MVLRRVCVFCGSSLGATAVYATAVEALGAAIVARGAGVVYGGGAVGLMGRLADAALRNSGEVDGVIPSALVQKEVAHRGLTRLHVVESMHERKATMASLSDAFVAAPGGLGTLEELFEVLTWAQLGMHGKPCGLLDVDGYYQPLLRFLDAAVERGFVRPEHRAMVLVRTEPDPLLEALAAYVPPRVEKWIDRGET